MHQKQFIHTTFDLCKDGEFWKELNIVHNIGDYIFAAFDNWEARTSDYTEQSLCDYIKSKDVENIIAIPYDIYEELCNEE